MGLNSGADLYHVYIYVSYVYIYIYIYIYIYMYLSIYLSIYLSFYLSIYIYIVLNRLVQFNVIRRYVKTNSIHTTHRLNALAAPPGIRV